MKRTVLLLFLCLFLAFSVVSQAVGLEVNLEPNIAWQGKVVSIYLISAGGVSSVTGSFLKQKFKLYQEGTDYKGIVGVPLDQKAGYYDLELLITNKDNTQQELVKKVKVWDTNFPFSKFWLKSSRNKLRTRKIVDNEWGQIDKVLRVEGSKQLWQGKFSWPVTAKVSQGFGYREIINGKRAGSHRGVDLAVISGTKVKAPNRAKVVFAKKLKAFGGTILLDHGQGIHTLYFHLSKFVAKVGDAVNKGQVIALSGNSGISSGAHLHWGMSVHNLRVDPEQWTKYDI